jgi:hypothetical protein
MPIHPLGVAFGLILTLLATPPANADDVRAEGCLHIGRVTAFAPRGEVYVEVNATCGPEDFSTGEAIIAQLEVLLSDLPPVWEDVRVPVDQGQGRFTYLFEDLGLASGDPVLVRLVRFGTVLDLQSIKVP